MTLELTEEEYLLHYGTPRHSGRYPWGSTNNVPQNNASLLDMIDDMRSKGLTDTQIARGLGMTTTEYRAKKTIAKNAKKREEIDRAWELKNKGYSNVAISEKMFGTPTKESNVRALTAEGAREKADILLNTANVLKKHVDEKEFLDVGAGVEHFLGVSKTKMDAALAILKEWGYNVHSGIKVPQLNTRHETQMKVLTKPGVEWADAARARDQIKQVTEFSDDGGRSYFGLHPPISVDSKRVQVKYKDDGGADADGVIYVRPGVDDLSLGNSSYAQVRILVDGTHFLKGMAVYSDDLPEGVDLVYNTIKTRTDDPHDAMKEISDDPDNPFGASVKQLGTQGETDGEGEIIRQLVARESDGTEKVTSAMNIVNAEGDWLSWNRTLSSQFLSKQNPKMAKRQLDMTYENRVTDFDEIMSLTNPSVKQTLLEEFADNADSAAVHLKAAALPRQNTQVLLPSTEVKPTKIFAPNYNDGDTVALIRHPHSGPFEIPVLTVDNSSKKVAKDLGTARDAVVIHPSVAEQLSGADFDGDTVIVVPNDGVVAKPPLKALEGFDPREQFKGYEGMKNIGGNKQTEMGRISNLITDMTIQKASSEELARAVKHSMVVIDAEKHNLDWKRSEREHAIKALRQKYQGTGRGGASTLLSRAGATKRIPKRKPRTASKGGPIDPETGKLMYEPTNQTYINKKGEEVPSIEKHDRLAVTDDAHDLSSGTPIERLYADHSNRLKALANRARKEMLQTKPVKRDPGAAKVYDAEVKSLSAKLTQAERNKPLERQARVIANAQYRLKRQANPNMDDDVKKRVKKQLLDEARARTGASNQAFKITDSEWDAIQAGAVSPTKLSSILRNADSDRVKKLATPRTKKVVTPAKLSRAQAMLAMGYTRSEVAGQLGIALGTLDEALYGGEG